jgi:hypothetical protein
MSADVDYLHVVICTVDIIRKMRRAARRRGQSDVKTANDMQRIDGAVTIKMVLEGCFEGPRCCGSGQADPPAKKEKEQRIRRRQRKRQREPKWGP